MAAKLDQFFLLAPSKFHVLFSHYSLPAPTCTCLIAPPFAEELNKSRRMLAQLQLMLAAANVASLLIDFSGTGDSEGDFSDATAENWQTELSFASNWLQEKHTNIPRHTLGLRTGALFAASVAKESNSSANKVFLWQPVLNGQQFMTQFLRLKIGTDIVSNSAETLTTKTIHTNILDQGVDEIAGYPLTATLLQEMEKIKLPAILEELEHEVHWFEIAPAENRPLTPATRGALAQLEKAGKQIHTCQLVGDSFWATQEIAECPDLIDQTIQRMTT